MPGLKRVFILSFVLMLTVFCFVSCDDEETDFSIDDPPSYGISIPALLGTTGNSASFGEASWAAIELAENDINEWLNEVDENWTAHFYLMNTNGSVDSALSQLERVESGVSKIVIGPTTSSEAAYIRDYATANDILLISPSSVAISMAISNDNLYRFVTDDTYQAVAMNAMFIDDDIDIIIPISRDDVWGNDLLAAVSEEFEAAGGTVLEGVKYDPSTEDFTPIIDTLEDKIDAAVLEYEDQKIGVYALTFSEISTILGRVSETEIPLDLNWYGSSAAAKNADLITNTIAAEIASTVGFPCSVYGDNDSPEFDDLRTRLETKLGREAESYAFAAYDAAWVAVKSYFETGTDHPEFATLNAKFEEICETYEGVTGPVVLNEAGDRRFGNYDFWQIHAVGDSYEWYKAARYEIDPNTYDGTLVRY